MLVKHLYPICAGSVVVIQDEFIDVHNVTEWSRNLSNNTIQLKFQQADPLLFKFDSLDQNNSTWAHFLSVLENTKGSNDRPN